MGIAEDAIRDSVHAHLFSVLDSLRGHCGIDDAVRSLLVNAGRWKAESLGSAMEDFDGFESEGFLGARGYERVAPILDRERNWLATCSPESVQEYAKRLTGYSGYEQTTSGSLIDVVATAFSAYGQESTPVGPARMFDPACGIGGLALSVLERLGADQPVGFAGQDINRWTAQCARANALLRNVDGAVYSADSLRIDGFPGQNFSYAVAEPPWGMSWASVKEHVAAEANPNGRYPGGVPESSDATLLFAQLLVGKLRAPEDGGGRAVMLTTPRPLWSARSGSVRSWLLKEDLLEAVIALPEGLSNSTHVRLYALVMSNIKSAGRRGKVQFIDLRGFYEDGPGRLEPRRKVTATGLQELSRSIGRLSGSANSRTVDADDLVYRQVRVSHRGRVVAEDGLSESAPMLNVVVPANTDLVEWRDARYRTAPPDVQEAPKSAVPLLGIDRVMQGRQHGQVARSLQLLKWPTTRLTELIGLASYVRSAKAPERAAAISAVAGTQALMVPIEPHLAAVAGDPGTVAPGSRILIIQLDETLADADYIAAFLNSAAGRQSRSAAADGHGESLGLRSVSASDAWRMADEVLIALPPLADQREMARAEASLDSAAQRLADARLQLWREPSKRTAITRDARRMTPSRELTEWLSTLPFPMAAALWAFESKAGNVHARHKQMFLCWEAAIEFHAAVLYSGLAQDQTRLVQETAHLASKFADVGLKPERGTLGVWQGIVGRLSKVFREHLTGTDTDEQARVRATFAEPPQDVLDLLFSADIVKIFSQVINLRNSWSGHTGATGDDALQDQLDILQGHLQTFRNLTGDAWLGFPLVRAGGSQFRDGVFRHDADLVMGPNTPFRKGAVQVTSPMEMNGLYLVSHETSRALPLVPLIQLRPAGFGQQSSCYCYNRIQADGIRLVSYHDATTPEVVEQIDALVGIVKALCADEGP